MSTRAVWRASATALLLWAGVVGVVAPAAAQALPYTSAAPINAPSAWVKVAPSALGLLSAHTVPEGSALQQADIQYALSGTTRRISGVVLRDSGNTTTSPADLQVELLSPRQGARLVPAGNGWNLVLSPQATQPGAKLTVLIAARSASRGQQAVLQGRVDVLARREARLRVPASGGSFQLADRVIEFDAVPAARGTLARDVTVHYALLPGSSAMLSRVLPTGLREPSPATVAAVGAYRIVPAQAISPTAAVVPEGTSLVDELNTTTPYSLVPTLLRHVWDNYSGPYISAGKRRLPAADVDSINSESGQLTSLVSTGWPASQWAAVTPVLFVHGYQEHFTGASPYFSGGKAYWGNLPNLVRQYTGNAAKRFAPFEYRWNTDAQFRVQGAELAKAINTIYTQTGRKPIVVAHSFGGLLVRTVLQDLVGAEGSQARGRVESVMTLGTPHSGIAAAATTLHGVALPAGQQPGLFPLCAQVSCHVAGEPVTELAEDELLRLGLTPEAGVDVAALATTAAQLPAIRLAQGVGVDQDYVNEYSSTRYRRGDGLISTEGQRLFPNEVDAAFRGWSTVAGSPATVKEIVLGHVDGPYIIRAGESVDTNRWVPADRWASSGYFHGESNAKLGGEPKAGRQTQVPATASTGCNQPTTCQHASWRLLVELLGSGGMLNDTGQTTCVDAVRGSTPIPCAGTGQDGESGRDVSANDASDGRAGFSYVKISSTGAELPASATTWACVKDKLTGLIWEVKTDDGGLRDKDNRYTNLGNGESGDASAFVSAVNSTGLCGARDWRLPTRGELQGLVDYGRTYPGPTIDTAWFPNTNGWRYWTSTTFARQASAAWTVLFSRGDVYYSYRDSGEGSAVRLVRAGQ